MSWTDSILSSTVGVVYRGVSGNVDPWTLKQLKDQAAADAKVALGPNASAADVAAAQVNAASGVDSYLKSVDSHPDTAGARLPGLGVVGTPEFLARLEKIVYGVIAVGGIIGAVYFAQRYGSIVKKTFRKR